jgi:methylated-DNA-[protein]-cysteine S-methyltransferase
MPYHKPSSTPALAIFGREIILNIDVRKRPARLKKRFILKAMKTTKNKQTTYSYKTMKSPVGRLKLVASQRGLAAILWENDDPKRVRLAPLVEDKNHPVLLETERQLNDYFAGKLKKFSLRFDFAGTEFQKEVWRALAAIPFGETRSYGDIARQIGRPKAVRAVGAANGRNPISIIVPCHRVIGSNGKLTGFAGGLETKAFLLKTESGNEDLSHLKRRPMAIVL